MNTPHLLIIGCGDIGARVANSLLSVGWQVSAVRRTPDHLPEGVTGYAGDYSQPDGLATLQGLQPDVCLFTPLPASRDESGYRRGFCYGVEQITAAGVLARCRRLLYVSSTRVYAEQDGGVVDEQAALTTSDPLGVAIQEGEALARAQVPTTVVRPAGVYGAIPAMMVERVLSGSGSADPERISNRIHRDDLSGLLVSLAERAITDNAMPATVNAADDEPAPIGEVESWLATRLGVALTPGSGGRSVRGNRRVSNAVLHELGYELRFPTWREGYAALLAARDES